MNGSKRHFVTTEQRAGKANIKNNRQQKQQMTKTNNQKRKQQGNKKPSTEKISSKATKSDRQ
jgi:hypothetical protein